ncbi:MAG: hypothetical protein ACREMA_15070 [Longimicrobiales bacterium]
MRRYAVYFSASCALLIPRALLACSPAAGVDPAVFAAEMARPPYVLGGISVLTAIAWLVFRRYHSLPRPGARGAILWALALLQPAWWIGSGMGDCGMLRDSAALITAVISAVVLSTVLLRARHRARNSASA